MNKYCIDCDESYQVHKDSSSCSICGSTFQSSMTTSNEITNNTVEPTRMTDTRNTMENISFDSIMTELIGNVDFRSFEESIRSQTNKKLSRQYLSSLGKVMVDSRGVILYDCYIQIGDANVTTSTISSSSSSSSVVRITAIPAEFSPLPVNKIQNHSNNSITSPNPNTSNDTINPTLPSTTKFISSITDIELVISDPIYGGYEDLIINNTIATPTTNNNTNNTNNKQNIKLPSNAADCQNKMVIMSRGGNISFAAKAKIAQLSGASCLIVTQTYDMWPFVMTDNVHEIMYDGDINDDEDEDDDDDDDDDDESDMDNNVMIDNNHDNHITNINTNNCTSNIRLKINKIHHKNNNDVFKLNIPVVMISKEDSLQLKKLLSSCKHAVKATLFLGEQITQCAICCDTMMMMTSASSSTASSSSSSSSAVSSSSSSSSVSSSAASFSSSSASSAAASSSSSSSQEVLKLPCRHVFHSSCIHSWLVNHNSCPMCRYNMLSDTNGEIRSDTSTTTNTNSNTTGGGEITIINHNQPYFI